MDRINNEKFIVLVATLGAVGLITENIIMGWEFWVPVVILTGTVALWAVNLTERIDHDIRRVFYFGFAAMLVFYHGIHSNGMFDIALTVVLVLVTYSLLDCLYMMNAFLLEYSILLFIHLINLPGGNPIIYDRFTVVRILIHISTVLVIYYTCVRSINDRIDDEEERKIQSERIRENDENMEDFLSNISHELRTPVNVVNGMSDLMIKQGVGYEADAVKQAGVRLANHIEDIQDYTECKRHKVFLEEDNYMSTSLVNDIVTVFRTSDKASDLELIVDLDPAVPSMMIGDIKKLHKIFRHLLDNAVKFTRKGGIYLKLYSEDTDYGVNLCIEMTDTGIGMDVGAVKAISDGMYQANKKRNRNSGGIGLGLFVVYGFAHSMGGFVKIESEKRIGTTVRVTIPQKVVEKEPCLTLEESFDGAVLFHVRPDKYKTPRLREFYRNMAGNLAAGIHVPLYSAETVYEVERLKEKLNVTHVFMGQDEYEENRGYFEELAKEDIVIAVSADSKLKIPDGSRVLLMPKPLYAYPVIKILNEGFGDGNTDDQKLTEKPVFKDVKALIVDDEPMNLVVATSLFRDYEMIIDTAGSGLEAIKKFRSNDYDLIFMDHMMPEMDGVEAMRQIRTSASDLHKEVRIVALTANAVSGAREMFIKEGFDGFISKPINTSDFERVMLRVLSGFNSGRGGEKR